MLRAFRTKRVEEKKPQLFLLPSHLLQWDKLAFSKAKKL